jgi:hypothetical protein
MEGNIQHRMYHFEVLPPAGVWENIAATLNTESATQTPEADNRLYHFEVEPPAAAWENIAAALDQEKGLSALQTRLYQYEVNPPAAAWEKIASTLDQETVLPDWQKKLYQFEIDPPAAAWTNITAVLDASEKTPVISINKKSRSQLLRLAAGVAALAIAIFAVSVIMNKKPTAADTPVAAKEVPKPAGTDSQDPAVSPVTAEPEGTTNTNEVLAENPGTISNDPAQNYLADISLDKLPYNEVAPITSDRLQLEQVFPKLKNSKGVIEEDMNLIGAANNGYITIAGPNGMPVRVSAKLANVIQYLNDDSPEEYLDKVIRESTIWKKKFRNWKEKLAESPFLPSPGNFLDINAFSNIMLDRK